MLLSQSKYVLELLRNFDMLATKPVTTPMATKPHLSAQESELLSEPSVTMNRPNISFAVSLINEFINQSCLPHLRAINIYFAFSLAPFHMVCSYKNILCFIYMLMWMLTGLAATPPRDFACSLVQTLSPVVPRSKRL